MERKEIIDRIQKEFNQEDKQEPYMDRFYVEETNRLLDLLKEGNGDFPDATERAIYDIVTDLIRVLKK